MPHLRQGHLWTDKFLIKNDYKPERLKTKPERSVISRHLLILTGIAVGIGVVLGFEPNPVSTSRAKSLASDTVALSPTSSEDKASLTASRPETASPTTKQIVHASNASGQWHTAAVKPGDNLSLIFKRHGLSAKQLQKILSLGKDARALKRIFPGDSLSLYIDDDQQLRKLIYDISDVRTLEITKRENDFIPRIIKHQPDVRQSHASAVINNSLFLAAQRAGLSDNITMELAAIFGWDIDFSLDIRQGDHFTVIYEELFLNGDKLKDGKILAAEFISRGKSYRAVRYADSKGRTDYYSPDGKSMRKEFLRSPVDFTRVSSRFSLGRKHPVLNKIRAHKGVDYAASRGTPIKATGDGRIIFRGRKGGYGKAVIIEHGSRYSTLYAHMNSFARGTGNGRRVKQGQIIGFVGSTGLATGPHLHYEFRVNGVHRNPLTVKFPDASPLGRTYMADFSTKAAPYLARLDLLNRSTIAFNTPQGNSKKSKP